MKIPSIKDVMHEQSKLVKYEQDEHGGKLWYQILWSDYGDVQRDPNGDSYAMPRLFDFPVPIGADTCGTFERSMKAVSLMRWIRLHIEFLTEAAKEQTP